MKLKFFDRWFAGNLIVERLSGLTRLYVAAFSAVALVFLIAIAASAVLARQTSTLSEYQFRIGVFNSDLLQLRRNEKDFFERRSAAELEKHAASAKRARESIGELLRSDAPTPADRDSLMKVQAGLEGYLTEFKAAADQQVKLGFNENLGLQGALRKAVHAVETELVSKHEDVLTVSMLTLRRHEKDFILRERDQYVKSFATEIAKFKTLLAAASRLDAGLRGQISTLMDSYDKSFQEFVAGTLDVNKGIAAARAKAHSTEEPLPGLIAEAAKRRTAIGDLANGLQIALFALFTIVLVGAAVVMSRSLRATSASIIEPLGQLSNTVQSVTKGEYDARSRVRSENEFGVLSQAFDKMLDERLEALQKAEAENERLNNSVISLLQAVNQLSQRDLTARAPVTQDIIGTVSDSINQLTEETSKVLHGMADIADQVVQGSNNVRSQGQMVTQTAQADRVSVSEMIQRLANSTQTMNQVAALTEQSNRSAEQATQATDNALATVNGTVKGMESIRETIAETEKRIKRLGERSQEISGIVNLINTISERTHVLALNASMQAAVAGEAGRGFAVVAEEVQRLAESSRNATQQIATLVNNIQLETNETINTVNRTIGQVVTGSELAQKAGEQMRRTQEITGELVQQVRHIANASELQKSVSVDLLSAVQEIGKSTDRTSKQIDAQNVETDSLLGLARRLVESVSLFKLPKTA